MHSYELQIIVLSVLRLIRHALTRRALCPLSYALSSCARGTLLVRCALTIRQYLKVFDRLGHDHDGNSQEPELETISHEDIRFRGQ